MRGEHLGSDRDGNHTVLWPPLHFGALPYTGNLWHLLESTWAPEAATRACFPQRLQVIQVGKLITQDHRFADLWSSLLWRVYILGSGLCFGFSWSVFFFLILQITYICNFFSWSGDGAQDLVFTGQDLSLRTTPVPLTFALYLSFFFFLMIFLFCSFLHSLQIPFQIYILQLLFRSVTWCHSLAAWRRLWSAARLLPILQPLQSTPLTEQWLPSPWDLGN